MKDSKNKTKIPFNIKGDLKKEIDKLRDTALDIEYALKYLDKYLSILESSYYRVEYMDDVQPLQTKINEVWDLLNSTLCNFKDNIKNFDD